MKNKLINSLLSLVIVGLLVPAGYIVFYDNNVAAEVDLSDYRESGTITGTVEGVLRVQKMIVVKSDQNVGKDTTYKIPVGNIEKYQDGQRVEVTIYSNTLTDEWVLKNMKFDIKIID
jgi:hypothetical protein